MCSMNEYLSDYSYNQVYFNDRHNDNISVISWWSVLFMEETRLPVETTDLSQVTDKLDCSLLYLKMDFYTI